MTHTCPNCGAPVPDHIDTVVMLTCAQCATTLYVDGSRLRDAGQSGHMHDGPLLFGLGHRVTLAHATVDILGHARFSYGRGWWDEFWGTDRKGRGVWISVDEGDVVLQRPMVQPPDIGRSGRVGSGFQHGSEAFRIVETGDSTCTALRGQFGEVLLVGERYGYLNAQGDEGHLISGEFAPDGSQTWFLGEWHDPFDIAIGVQS